MVRLRRVSCSGPGIARVRSGTGFRYLDAAGAPLTDEAALARIEALVIPPAWEDVWICSIANGHVQATGVDVKGRRQYRYHDAWRVQRDVACTWAELTRVVRRRRLSVWRGPRIDPGRRRTPPRLRGSA